MRYFITIIGIALSIQIHSQDYQPYNTEYIFKVIDNQEKIHKQGSLEALVILFKDSLINNSKESIINNPQLKEINLVNPSQEFIDFISDQNLRPLTHLIIKEFSADSLILLNFSTIEHLAIESKKLKALFMLKSSFIKLSILDIHAPNLEYWQTYKQIPNLSLIELYAPKLEHFPIFNMPKITQFSYHCSFKELPLGLCTYKNLMYISFENFNEIEVDKCFRRKVKKGVYSNLTVRDKMNGSIIFEIRSQDRKSKK